MNNQQGGQQGLGNKGVNPGQQSKPATPDKDKNPSKKDQTGKGGDLR